MENKENVLEKNNVTPVYLQTEEQHIKLRARDVNIRVKKIVDKIKIVLKCQSVRVIVTSALKLELFNKR